MEFQEILVERSETYQTIWLLLLGFGASLVIFTVVFLAHEVEVSIGSMIAITLGVSFSVGSYYAHQEYDAIQKSNEAALVHNIEQKYDVDLVLLDAPEVDVKADDVGAQNVSVVVDSVSYTFLLTQDENTWEPTLINPSIPGGSSEVVNQSAEDLLKVTQQ